MISWGMRRCVLVLFFAAACSTLGCGGTTAETEGTGEKPEVGAGGGSAEGKKSYALSDLKVGLGEYLPPLDEGRVEMAPPEGWIAPGRQKNYVVWFATSKNAKQLPQIRVTAKDAPADAPTNVTESNLPELKSWLDSELKDTNLLESPSQLVLGDNAFGRYVRSAKYDGAPAERQILVTVHNGRLYEIELIVPGDSLLEYRDAAYVVGAGLKYLAPGEGNLVPPAAGPMP